MTEPIKTYDELVKALHELQGDQCGMCGKSDTLDVDHDHKSGFVRGLLCKSCNTKEGMNLCLNWEEEERFRPCGRCELCVYRAIPPTSWLGFTMRYKRASFSDLAEWEYNWKPSRIIKRIYDDKQLAVINMMRNRVWDLPEE